MLTVAVHPRSPKSDDVRVKEEELQVYHMQEKQSVSVCQLLRSERSFCPRQQTVGVFVTDDLKFLLCHPGSSCVVNGFKRPLLKTLKAFQFCCRCYFDDSSCTISYSLFVATGLVANSQR